MTTNRNPAPGAGGDMTKLVATIRKNRREQVQVELSEYQGHDLVQVRIYVDNGAKFIPTPKGIAVRVALLPELVAALAEAARQARADGLLGGDDAVEA